MVSASIMEILLKARNRQISQTVVNDHYWYDTETKQMFHGKGSEMKFSYVNGRSIPHITNHQELVWKNDFDEIMKWLKKNSHRASVISQAKNHYVLIDVEKNDADDVSNDLLRQNILFEEV